MATQSNAKPQGAAHTHEGEDKECTRVTFGPFGDKAVHGSRLAYGTAESNPDKRDKGDTLKADAWCFSYWVPANAGEVKAFAASKPDTVGALLAKALEAKARFASWQENRGGATTVDVMVDGVLSKRVPVTIVEILKASGRKVTVVERKRKEA